VAAVSKRLLAKTSGQARLYYVFDVLLLLGFVLIGVTGLIISTWLNLSLSNFTTWLNIHITISIATLVTLLLKLAFHWRWIARATRKIWPKPTLAPAQTEIVQPANVRSSRMGRREFLQVIGIAGAASFLALANASQSLAETDTTNKGITTTQSTSSQSSLSSSNSSCTVSCRKACSYPGHCHRYVDTNNNGRCDLGECV
jgi:hypothetical protein